jgi:hypothetical protein
LRWWSHVLGLLELAIATNGVAAHGAWGGSSYDMDTFVEPKINVIRTMGSPSAAAISARPFALTRLTAVLMIGSDMVAGVLPHSSWEQIEFQLVFACRSSMQLDPMIGQLHLALQEQVADPAARIQ